MSDSALVPTGKEVDIRQVIAVVSQKTHKKFLIGPRVHVEVSLVGMDARTGHLQ